MTALSLTPHWRKPLWIAFLALASLVFSLGFACAVPLAAFAAIAALTLSRRDAFALVGAVWLANQIAGFAIHHYPLEPSTFAWGAALGTVALASTLAALWAKGSRTGWTFAVAAFLAAFTVYEGIRHLVRRWERRLEFFACHRGTHTGDQHRRLRGTLLIHQLGVFTGLAGKESRLSPRPSPLRPPA
jgi:hypothetical protein